MRSMNGAMKNFHSILFGIDYHTFPFTRSGPISEENSIWMPVTIDPVKVEVIIVCRIYWIHWWFHGHLSSIRSIQATCSMRNHFRFTVFRVQFSYIWWNSDYNYENTILSGSGLLSLHLTLSYTAWPWWTIICSPYHMGHIIWILSK